MRTIRAYGRNGRENEKHIITLWLKKERDEDEGGRAGNDFRWEKWINYKDEVEKQSLSWNLECESKHA